MNKSGIVIQCHIPSSRLYGKILKVVDRFTILERVLDTCTLAGFDKVIVATTTAPENLVLIDIIKEYNETWHDNVILYRYNGSESDLLSRYYAASKEYKLDQICRICSDSPLLSTDLIYLCSQAFKYTAADVVDFMAVDGLEVQITNFKTLEDAYNNAKFDYQKEHVFNYMYEHPEKFKIVHLEDLKISVDEESDLQRVREICQR